MELVIFYILMLCIGTVFGSFFTLAVYRIPLHQNITHKHSYCPNCKHKLGFWDMIPIISYIFLGGKCRYCKTKIRARYLFLEVFTGILFLVWTISLNINFYIIETSKLVYLVVSLLYVSGLIIIAGIDKEKISISKPILLYEIILISTYIIYLYIVENINIYRYVIYLLAICLLLIISNKIYKKKIKDNYSIDIVILSVLISIFTSEINFIITVIFTLIIITFIQILKIIKTKSNKIVKKDNKNEKKLPIGYYLCFSNVLVTIIINFIACRW